MNRKVFSGIDRLPRGSASKDITDGCIVLEGGAFRGLYTSGALDALMLAGINLQCTIGVSAGALNGLNYVSGQIGRSGRFNLTYRHDSRYVGAKAIRHNKGIIGFDFVFNLNESEPLDRERFFDPSRRFVAVATDCITGKPRYFEKGNNDSIFQAIRASASMPYVSHMVEVNGIPCLDGGCSDKIPYQWALDQGYKKILVVRTRPIDYRKAVSEKKTLTRRFYRSYPEFASTLSNSNAEYNRQCDELEALSLEKRIYLIAPSKAMNISRLEGDMEKLGLLYALGYRDVKSQISDIKAYLAQ